MARPPPKPIPKPGSIKVVRAMYNYVAQYPDELSFEEGDTLYILDKDTDPSWWRAKCHHKEGLIPSNYVEDSTESIDHPLHEAAKRGNTSFLKECLQNKVSANGLDKSGSTALHWACHGGHIECVVRLLEVPNIQIDVQNKLGDTPLHSASWKGHADVVKLLIDKGANIAMRNKDGKFPFDLAKEPSVAAILKQAASNPSDVPDDGYDDSDESD